MGLCAGTELAQSEAKETLFIVRQQRRKKLYNAPQTTAGGHHDNL